MMGKIGVMVGISRDYEEYDFNKVIIYDLERSMHIFIIN